MPTDATRGDVLVTGAAGALGTAFTSRLASSPSFRGRIIGLDLRDTPPGFPGSTWITARVGDRLTPPQLERLENVTHLVHLAAVVTNTAQPASGTWEEGYDTDVLGVADLVGSLPGLTHAVFSSSYMVYRQAGPGLTRQDESDGPHIDALLEPSNHYAWTKCAVENLLADLVPRNACLRFTGVYGPGVALSTGRTVMRIVEAGIGGGSVRLTGDGRARRNHLFIDDAVDALERCLTEEWLGTWDIAGPDAPSVRDVVAYVQDECNGAPPVLWDDPDFSAPSLVIDTSPVRERFGYSAKVTAPEGFRRYCRWARTVH